MLQLDFGAWQAAYGCSRERARRLLFQTIHRLELMLERQRQGRQASQCGGDRQPVGRGAIGGKARV